MPMVWSMDYGASMHHDIGNSKPTFSKGTGSPVL